MQLIARDRLRHLIAAAKQAVSAIDPAADNVSAATFQAAMAVSHAAGFLESFAISHPDDAEQMLVEFESLAGLVDESRALIFARG